MSGKVGLSRLKSGKVGRNFFLPVPVVVTLLHQFFGFDSRFPVLAGSLRCSSTALTDDGHMPVCRRWGQCVGSGRVMSVHVGGRSGQNGQFSYFGLWRLHSYTFPRCLC